MKKSEQIRQEFTAGGELDLDAVSGATELDRNFVSAILSQMVKRGELLIREKDGAKHWRKNPDHVSKRSAPPQKFTAKSQSKRSAQKEKYMKKTTKRKYTKRRKLGVKTRSIGAEEATVAILALQNYIAASAQLRQTLNVEVSGIEGGSPLDTAIQNHDRAALLYQAASESEA